MKNKAGFTLIELIVSVTIIAVLTVIGVISYAGASQKARDGRRVADLEKIRIALELYRQNVGSYPASLTDLETEYMQQLPVGPKGEDYGTDYTATAFTYTIDVVVESAGTSNVPGYYEVKNP